MKENKLNFRARLLVIILALVMLITSTPFYLWQVNAAEPNDTATSSDLMYNGLPVQRGFTSYYSYLDEERTYQTYFYSDGYFLDDTSYNSHLATLSAAMAFASTCSESDDDVTNLPTSMAEDILLGAGFGEDYNVYNRGIVGDDTVGAIYGCKEVKVPDGQDFLLIPVSIRDLGISAEWYTNCMAGDSGNAEGIASHAAEIDEIIDAYVTQCKSKYSNDNIKLWVTGYACGGAIANLLAASLTDTYGAGKVYAYTYNTMAAANISAETASGYTNIHNVINYNDLLQFVLPEYMGFRYYGDAHYVANTDADDFADKEAAMLKQLKLIVNGVANSKFKLDEEYASPTNFQLAKINSTIVNATSVLSLFGLLPELTAENADVMEIVLDKGNTGKEYMHQIIEKILERLPNAISDRSVIASQTLDSNITNASNVDNPYTIMEAMLRVIKIIGGDTSMFTKDMLEQLKSNAKSAATNLTGGFRGVVFDLLGLLRDNKGYGKDMLTNVWYALTSKPKQGLFSPAWSGLKIDEILNDETLLNDIKRVIPTLLYYAPKYTTVDLKSKTNGGIETIASIINNVDCFLQAHSPDLLMAYLRSEDSYYAAEFLPALQRFGYQASSRISGDNKVPYNNRSSEGYDEAIETSITGLNGTSLVGMSIKFTNYDNEVIYKWNITEDGAQTEKNNSNDRVYFSPTFSEQGRINELSIITYNRGYIVDISTNNDSEDTPRKYRVKRRYIDRLTETISQQNCDYHKKSADIQKLDYIDFHMYKNQQARIVIYDSRAEKNKENGLVEVNRIGKFVSPHISVTIDDEAADSSLLSATPLNGRGRDKYNEIEYTYADYKDGEKIELYSNDKLLNPKNNQWWNAYEYTDKNPNVELKIYTDIHHGHNITSTPAVAATCTTAGNSAYWYCQDCDKHYSDEKCLNEIAEDSWVIAALGHDMEDKHEAREATCEQYGRIEYYHCRRCEKNFNDEVGTTELSSTDIVIPQKDHSYTVETADNDHLKSNATCTAPAVYYKECSMCGKISDSETFTQGEAKGHTWSRSYLTKEGFEPTCTETGIGIYKCLKCYAEKEEVIPALGHIMKEVPYKAPTCLKDGTYACYECVGEMKTADDHHYYKDLAGTQPYADNERIIPKTGIHEFIEEADNKYLKSELDCDTNMEYYKHCKWCELSTHDLDSGDQDYDASFVAEGAKGHDWSVTERQEATCTEDGHITRKCNVCHKEETETIPKLGHKGKHIEAVVSTCTKAGNTEYWECEHCHKLFSDESLETEITKQDTVLDKAAHTYGNFFDEKYLCTPATCTEPTYYYKSCSVCGRSSKGTADEETFNDNSPLGHEFDEENANVETAATCMAEGKKVAKCIRCDETKNIVIPKLSHVLTNIPALEPGCVDDGCIEHWECSLCHNKFADENGKFMYETETWKRANLGGHKITIHADEVAATKEATGLKEHWACEVCDAWFEDEAGTLGHEHDWFTIAKLPDGGGGSSSGGGGGSTDPEPQQPVQKDVDVKIDEKSIEQKDGTATLNIDAAQEKAILDSIKEGVEVITLELVFEPTSDELQATIANVPNSILAKIASVGSSLAVNAPMGDIVIDSKAVKSIVDQLGGAKLKLGVEKNIKNDSKTYCEYDITAKYGKKQITKFGEGTLNISVPLASGLTEKTGIKAININGKYAYDMKATVDNKEQQAVFDTTHLSKYAVTNNKNASKLLTKSIKASTVGKPKLSSAAKTVTLTWKDGKGNTPDKYFIYRSLKKKSGFKKVGTATEKSFVDKKSLRKGKKYYYKVVGAVNLGTKSYNTKASTINSIKCK